MLTQKEIEDFGWIYLTTEPGSYFDRDLEEHVDLDFNIYTKKEFSLSHFDKFITIYNDAEKKFYFQGYIKTSNELKMILDMLNITRIKKSQVFKLDLEERNLLDEFLVLKEKKLLRGMGWNL
jgi:hypothetical protein